MRLSICGGGSDLPEFLKYENFGYTLTTTLNKYVYVAIHESSNEKYRFVYSDIEECSDISQIKHKILKELFQHRNTSRKIELFSIADLPAKGTGLGASSAFTLAAVAAVSEFNLTPESNLDYAKIASHIEMELAESGSGFQDQYASATGGITLLEFSRNGLTKSTAITDNLQNSELILDWLNEHLVFVKAPGSRESGKILKSIAFSDSKIRNLQIEIRNLVIPAIDSVLNQDINQLGNILHENWRIKKDLSPSSTNETVNDLYEKGINSGALGGKLLGAGGSGYLVFAVNSQTDFLNHSGFSETGIQLTGDKLEVKEI